jgi:hypothetical protein
MEEALAQVIDDHIDQPGTQRALLRLVRLSALHDVPPVPFLLWVGCRYEMSAGS